MKARSRSHQELKLGLHFQKDQSLTESFSVLNSEKVVELNPLRRPNAIKITNTIIRVHSNQDLEEESWTTPQSTRSLAKFIRAPPKSTTLKVLISSPPTPISFLLTKDNLTGNWDKRTCHNKPANGSKQAVNLRLRVAKFSMPSKTRGRTKHRWWRNARGNQNIELIKRTRWPAFWARIPHSHYSLGFHIHIPMQMLTKRKLRWWRTSNISIPTPTPHFHSTIQQPWRSPMRRLLAELTHMLIQRPCISNKDQNHNLWTFCNMKQSKKAATTSLLTPKSLALASWRGNANSIHRSRESKWI